ncbi:hypothetical protein [Pseudomonas savastanoi]|uniref:hypothetical protein n=1 Tax=Pseudomonas savastanoi TaxID=29438 RepID=UPI000E32A6E7|nr:hypothetical protein [Pseudomonas savastanoi]
MNTTVSIFCDDGEQFVFTGEQVLEVEFREYEPRAFLKVTFYKKSGAASGDNQPLIVARIISSNLHYCFPLCHSMTPDLDKPIKTISNISAFTGSGVSEVFKAFEEKHPRATLIDPAELDWPDPNAQS